MIQVPLSIPLLICVPFIVLLLLIAIMPLIYPAFWERNRNKALLTAVIALPVLLFMIIKLPDNLWGTFQEYISFILVLATLYIISGGILLTGNLQATPLVNTGFLLSGAILANLIGTTGASVLLIRPLLHTIRERKHVQHIPVFFIFIVSNIGGLLTPLGDPPLLLGYFRGVPFTWTFRLFPIWLTAITALLIIFYIWDTICYRKEVASDLIVDRGNRTPLRIRGMVNLLLLLIVILAILFQIPTPWRELVLLALMALSFLLTKTEIRRENKFTLNPIIEVATLFAGIFVTMAPLLILLETKGAALGITKPWQYFWLSGGLSSFLDNAPTYLTFTSLAASITHSLGGVAVPGIGVRPDLLQAISCGAVFMGANTYIGNGPNFMVKAIAEEQQVKVPHFFGYMLYSGMILIPLFIGLTFLFFI